MASEELYGSPKRYVYSPLIAVLFIPFSALPDRLSEILWRLFSTGVYLVALAWWCKVTLPRSLTRTQQAFLFFLVLPMSVGSLNNGQKQYHLNRLAAGHICRNCNRALDPLKRVCSPGCFMENLPNCSGLTFGRLLFSPFCSSVCPGSPCRDHRTVSSTRTRIRS
jgi:hypothetical protein